VPTCQKCGSTNIHAAKKGWTLASGGIGANNIYFVVLGMRLSISATTRVGRHSALAMDIHRRCQRHHLVEFGERKLI
jgi:hypothetical protein